MLPEALIGQLQTMGDVYALYRSRSLRTDELANRRRARSGSRSTTAARSHRDSVAFIRRFHPLTVLPVAHARAAHGRRLRATLGESRDRRTCPARAVIALVALDPTTTLAWMLGALSTGAAVAAVAADGPDRDAQLGSCDPDVSVTCAAHGAGDDRATTDPRRRAARRPAGRDVPSGVIVCTAGTTGAPKAIVHSHTTLAHAVRRLQLFRLESLGLPAGRPTTSASSPTTCSTRPPHPRSACATRPAAAHDDGGPDRRPPGSPRRRVRSCSLRSRTRAAARRAREANA